MTKWHFCLVGDLNINVLFSEKNIWDHLKDLIHLFSFKNLKSTATCTKGTSGTVTGLDIVLTSKRKCFHHTSVSTTGLSAYHKLILSCWSAHFRCLPPKKTFYRDCKSFNQENFLRELHEEIIKGTF